MPEAKRELEAAAQTVERRCLLSSNGRPKAAVLLPATTCCSALRPTRPLAGPAAASEADG